MTAEDRCRQRRVLRVASAVSAALLLTSCSADPAQDVPEPTDAQADTSAAPAPVPSAAVPDQFSGTAWRSIAEDGARYTTYLDAGGRYRDLRNGDPWAEGSWVLNDVDGQRLCFTPDSDDASQACWEPGAMSGDTLSATDADGRRIEVRQVEYEVPAASGEEDSAEDEGEPAT